MPEITTIQLEKKTLHELKKAKQYSRQTYSEIINNMLKVYKNHQSQYDEFLHKIQQEKMSELWGNKEDEAWEDA